MTKNEAKVIREITPLDDAPIHGVTFDGALVWFARDGELVAFDPEVGTVIRRHAVPAAAGGTAFDGTHLYQLAGDDVLVVRPADGSVVRTIHLQSSGQHSGMAWADGHLWIGQYRDAKIHKVDPATGAIVKTMTSDRFVTGVTCVDGAVWHGAVGNDQPCELRRLAADGSVEESMTVPVSSISGVESTPDGFWCGGERGKLRLVRRKD